MDEKVENNSRRSFFKYAGLGAAGLLLGGYTNAVWNSKAPVIPLALSAGRLDISQGKTTRWTRYSDVSKEAVESSTRRHTPWEQQELDDPLVYQSSLAWMTDIDLVNNGDNLKASLKGTYGGEDYYAEFGTYYEGLPPDLYVEMQFVGMLINRQPHTSETVYDLTHDPDIEQDTSLFGGQALKTRKELDEKYEVYHRGMFTQDRNLDSNGASIEYIEEDGVIVGADINHDVFEIEDLEVPSGTTSCTLIISGEIYTNGTFGYDQDPSRINSLITLGKVDYSLRQVL